jgi:hypothetical protein
MAPALRVFSAMDVGLVFIAAETGFGVCSDEATAGEKTREDRRSLTAPREWWQAWELSLF